MGGFVTDKINALPYSGIRRFFDLADEMKDIVSLGVGEPDFFTPWSVREEAVYFLENKRSSYTSNAGLMALREAVCAYVENKYGLKYDPKTQCLITVGGSEAIDLALRAAVERDDEVIYHEPCFVSYNPCVLLAGGKPVAVGTYDENDFMLGPETLKSAITGKTKAFILSYPNNPTGAVMGKGGLGKLAEVLADKNILTISDEIYSELTYTDESHVSVASFPGMYEKTVVINGFSKAFAMTGWRLGYALGPPEIIAAMTKIHQYAIMCAPTTAQYAAVTALRNCDKDVSAMRDEYNYRRRVMTDGFSKIGLKCFTPYGAFYTFPSIRETGLSSTEFCERLLREQKVAVVPGCAFGGAGEGFIRCSYAYSVDKIKTAVNAIGEFLKGLKAR